MRCKKQHVTLPLLTLPCLQHQSHCYVSCSFLFHRTKPTSYEASNENCVCVLKWFTESTEKSLLYAVDPHLVYQLDPQLPRRNDTLLHCLSLRAAYTKHVCGATTTRMYTTDSLACPRHITQTEPSTRTP